MSGCQSGTANKSGILAFKLGQCLEIKDQLTMLCYFYLNVTAARSRCNFEKHTFEYLQQTSAAAALSSAKLSLRPQSLLAPILAAARATAFPFPNAVASALATPPGIY